MNPLSYYCYNHPDDFIFPDSIQNSMARHKGGLDRFFTSSSSHASELFLPSYTPQEADFIFFPFDLGLINDRFGASALEKVIKTLRYYPQYERKHVFVDYGDSLGAPPSSSLFFKISLQNNMPRRYVCLWYETPRHVATDAFRFSRLIPQHHVSFVGANSNPLRKLSCLSVLRCRKLRSFIDITEGVFTSQGFCAPKFEGETLIKRQEIFRESLKSSLFSLCPPGLGPQTVRFYESLYYGRIPILFRAETALPFEDAIDYDSFCLNISPEKAGDTADCILEFMNRRSAQDLREMCAKASKTYQEYFSNNKRLFHLHKKIRLHLENEAYSS